MKDLIQKSIKEIEQEKNITVLFAVECGSRIWGLNSPTSDYDVRLVYVMQSEDYITNTLLGRNFNTVIKYCLDKQGNRCGQDDCVVDVLGFDLARFMPLVLKSNPTAIEWLSSTENYCERKIPQAWVDEVTTNFEPIALFHHYKSLGKSNFKPEEKMTCKKYLYTLRGILCAEYVRGYGEIPPNDFNEVLERVIDRLPTEIVSETKNLIELKKSGKPIENCGSIRVLDDFILEYLGTWHSDVKLLNRKPNTDVFIKHIKEILN